jgi:hypothetical protein
MARAKKEGKKPRNRKNLTKNFKRLQNNVELLKKYETA